VKRIFNQKIGVKKMRKLTERKVVRRVALQAVSKFQKLNTASAASRSVGFKGEAYRPYRLRYRGITLLLVLALMTIFSMLVVTFMIVTSAAKNMAKKQAEALLDPRDRQLASLRNDSDRAIEQTLYGGFGSAIGALSILENLYGNMCTNGTIRIIDNTLAFGNSTDPSLSDCRRIYWNGSYSQYQRGHVLTLTEFATAIPNSLSPAQWAIERKYKNRSVLVKNFGVDGVGQYIDVEKFDDDDKLDFGILYSATGGTWRFIINSPAFSGTGEGVNSSAAPGTAILSAKADNPAEVEVPDLPRVFLPNLPTYGDSVKMNPDYPAPDHLTWFLAWYDIDGTTGRISNIIPSFHRPQIIRYLHSLGVDETTPNALRAATLRPLPTDHPNFTGSNPSATLGNLINFLTGEPNTELDVDNDNDGKKDSIWIDADLPQFEVRHRSTDKQTLAKPLMAVLIRDLDGLLNVNAHGNAAHVLNDFDTSPPSTLNSSDGAYNLGVRGLGMGPAEVRLDRVLGKGAGGLFDEIQRIRQISSSNSDHPASVDPNAYAGIYAGTARYGRLYPDFWGVSPITFEPMGYRFFDMPNKNHYQGNPYMTNVYSSDGNPFKINELEVFLRSQFDVDKDQFTHRLRDLFTSTGVDPVAYRYLITTHSSNIPAMSVFGGSGTTQNYDSLYARVREIAGSNADAIIRNLPPEIRRGEKIDLNRVTKMTTLAEKSEFAHQIYLLLMILSRENLTGYNEGGLNVNSVGETVATRLAQWSVNLVDFIDADATMTPMVFSRILTSTNYLSGNYIDYFKKFIANDDPTWESDQNSSWGIQTMQIVFGMENNDLFITKTLATHNRRTADSKNDDPAPCSDNSCSVIKGHVRMSSCTGTHDEDFDQIFKPEGSFYVELYRAGDPTRFRTTEEFYTPDNGLDLAKRVPNDNNNGDPVWRIAISHVYKETPTGTDVNKPSIISELNRNDKWNYKFQPYQRYADPDSATDSQQRVFLKYSSIKPERFIFFVDDVKTNQSQYADTDLSERSFVNKGTVVEDNGNKIHGNADTILRPNNFFLIAPRVLTSFKSKEVNETESTSKFGMPDEDSTGNYVDLKSFVGNSRVKTMVAAIDPKVLVDSGGSSDWNDQSKNILTLGFRTASDALDSNYRGIGVNVSEPLPTAANMTETDKYYPIPTYDPDNHKDSYVSTSTDFKVPNYGDTFVKGFGTIPSFRSIYLQRLADPNRQYHPVNNPYITVDWSLVDLHVFTSEKVRDADTSHRGGEFAAPGAISNKQFDEKLYFNIREWGTTGERSDLSSKRPNIRDRSFDNDTIENASEIKNDMTNNYEPPNLPTTGDRPEWGNLSHNYGTMRTATLPITEWDPSLYPNIDFTGIPEKGFVSFPWNDSPLASTFELLIVPAESPARFGYECYDSETTDPAFQKLAGSLGYGSNRFRNPDTMVGPYLNFFSSPNGAGNPSLDLVRLLEYVRVPSRFINTNQPLHAMREPGKINLNTMTAQSWEALGGDSASYGAITTRRSAGKPFRSPNAANVVPDNSQLQTPVETTLLDLLQPRGHVANTNDNLYTSMHHLIRLSEMTTTRSNVFAVWITTGYFRVDENGKLCEEIGTDDGTVERHRDFYIIDRSIPVGFIRGEKLNTQNVIIHKKSLE
jgi:hypothetical protein